MLVPSWSPPGSALVVASVDAGDGADTAAFLQQVLGAWVRLHQLAGGGSRLKLEDASASIVLAGTRVVAEYGLDRRSATRGKLIYVQIAGCRFAALDFVGWNTNAGLTRLLDGLDTGIEFADQPPLPPH